MRVYFILFFLLYTNSFTFGQIHVTNNTEEPLNVAVAYFENTNSFSGWISQGWYIIIPGETKIIGSFLKNGDNVYYLHAHSSVSESKWGDETFLAVKSDAFILKNCDKEYLINTDDVNVVGFDKYYVHIGLLELYEDYITLSE